MFVFIAAVLSPLLLAVLGTVAVCLWIIIVYQSEIVTFGRYEALMLIPPIFLFVGFDLALSVMGVDYLIAVALSRITRLMLYGTYAYLGVVAIKRAQR